MVVLGNRWDRWFLALLVVFVLIEDWPLVVGRDQPVGGDKTAFFYGLTAHYHHALAQGTLPWWNELWGFGFPGVAESQVGAFYPFHLLFYGLLPPLDAFRWNFLCHRLLLPVLGYLSLRGMSLGPAGAVLAALSISGGGFARGHLDHQWAVESIVWTLPILWATHTWICSGNRWGLAALPALVMLQLFVGHFQVAFMTAVAAVLWAIAVVGYASLRRLGWLAVALTLGYLLASIQLFPTAALVSHVRTIKPGFADTKYVGDFSLPPSMTLTGWLAPALYHVEPLWRRVAWDNWQTSPEESLRYVGWPVLALALGSLGGLFRTPLVRAAWIVFAVSLVLSWGKHVPLFDQLTNVPGFSYFRVPARWSWITDVSLAIAAGWALDRWRHAGRATPLWLLCLSLLVMTGVMALGHWTNWSADGVPPTMEASHSAPEAASQSPDGSQTVKGETITLKSPQSAEGLPPGQQLQWVRWGRGVYPLRLSANLGPTLGYEVLPTLIVVIVGTLLVIGLSTFSTRRRRWSLRLGAIALLVVDLLVFRWQIPDTRVALKDLKTSDNAEAKLAELPAGSRILTDGKNLPMAFGLAGVPPFLMMEPPYSRPLGAFLGHLQRGAQIKGIPSEAALAATLADIQARLVMAIVPPGTEPPADTVPAPPFIEWLYGDTKVWELQRGLTLQQTPNRELQLRVEVGGLRPPFPEPAGRAVVVAKNTAIAEMEVTPEWFHAIGKVESKQFDAANRRWTVTVREPAEFLVGECYMPGWVARVTGEGGESASMPVEKKLGYWQGITLPEPGTYNVQFEYVPPGRSAGMMASAIAVLIYLLALGVWGWQRRRIHATS